MVPRALALVLVVLSSVAYACIIPENPFPRKLAIRANMQYAAQGQPIRTSSGRCMDVNDLSAGDGSNNEVPIALNACDGSIGQQWDVMTQGQHIMSEGFALLVSTKAGTCVDIAAVSGSSPGLYACGGRTDGLGGESNHQLYVWQGGSGPVEFAVQSGLVNRALGPGQTCLSDGDGLLVLANCDPSNPSPPQQFTIGGGSSSPPSSGSSPPSAGNNPPNSNPAASSLAASNPTASSLPGSSLPGSGLPGSSLPGSSLPGSNVAEANLGGSNLTGSNSSDPLGAPGNTSPNQTIPAGSNPSASSGGTGNASKQRTISGSGTPSPSGSNTHGSSGAMGNTSKHVNLAAIIVPIVVVTFLVVVAFLVWRRRGLKRGIPNPIETSETSMFRRIGFGMTRTPERESFGFGTNDPVMTTSARHSISQMYINHEDPSTVLPSTGLARMSTSQWSDDVDIDQLASLVAARIDPDSTLTTDRNQNQNMNIVVPVRANGTTAAVNIDDIMSMVAARLDPSFLTRSGDTLSASGDVLPSYQTPPVYDDPAPRSTSAHRDEKS